MTRTFYVAGTSWLHRLNPRTKLTALAAAIIVTFAAPSWYYAAGLGAIAVGVAISAKVGRRLGVLAMKLALPVIAVIALVQGLFFPYGSTVLWSAGPIRVTHEGLRFVLLIACRVAALVLSSLLVLLTTHPARTLAALTQAGVSAKISYVIATSLQIIPAFQERGRSILLAQQARGLALSAGALGRLRALVPLIGPLVLGMITEVDERSAAMEARSFGAVARPTCLTRVPDSTTQRIWRWLLLAFALFTIVAAFLGWLA